MGILPDLLHHIYCNWPVISGGPQHYIEQMQTNRVVASADSLYLGEKKPAPGSGSATVVKPPLKLKKPGG